jgi:dienelactone hydrolase
MSGDIGVLQTCRGNGQAASMSRIKRVGLRRITLLPALFMTIVFFAPARAEGVRTDPLQIPAVIGGSSFALEAIVVRPDDGQPHPLAVLNHGSPRDAADRPKKSPYGMWAQAMAFARRGWVAVAFMRRGYGRSQGVWAAPAGPCSNRDYARAGLAEASDIAAVATFMSGQNYVSKGKWISVGVSAGGFATVALTSQAPRDLAAAIAFAPGRGSSAPDTVCGENGLVAAFAQYGKTSRVPLLWVSAENDHFFGPQLTGKLTAAFSRAGGHLAFVGAPAFGDDGHMLFSAHGLTIWSPIVDKFLASNNLVLRDRLIDVPTPDVPAPSSLNARGRETFKTYLDSGPNKAFVLSGSHYGWATGRRTTDEAIKDAMDFCKPDRGAKCAVVNVNNKPAN